MKVPTPAQLARLVAEAEAADPVLAAAIALAALTGVRRGELCALRWSDVDLEAGTVHIERAITVVAKTAYEGPTISEHAHLCQQCALSNHGATTACAVRDRWVSRTKRVLRSPYTMASRKDGPCPASPAWTRHWSDQRRCPTTSHPDIGDLGRVAAVIWPEPVLQRLVEVEGTPTHAVGIGESGPEEP
jgi:hypothetical protein